MGITTGIELGPDCCVLAGVRSTHGTVEIVALHTIESAAWPAQDLALAEVLRSARQSKKLPRNARVVAWGLPEDSADIAMARAATRTVAAAGFRIQRVLTPAQALAILAGTRAKPAAPNTAAVWLALNRHGVAIAIARGAELLFARTFQWAYNPNVFDSKAQLLQRYSLIAHLAPEVRRGIAAVRSSYGVHVDSVVTCGDLPELRSLTMPLIDELDLEVETLDSLEGLRPVGKAKLEPVAELAPAIRLACAAALARPEATRRRPVPIARVAAAAAVVGLAYGAYAYITRSGPTTGTTGSTRAAGHAPVTRAVSRTAQEQQGKKLPPPQTAQPEPAPQEPAPQEARAVPSVNRTMAPVPSSREAAQVPARANTSSRAPTASQETARAAPVRTARQGPSSRPPSARQTTKPEVGVTAPDYAVARPPEPTARPSSSSGDTRGLLYPTARRPKDRQVPLAEPLPKVDSVLIDQDRRLAIVDGSVVSVGHQIGQRVVVGIDRDAVTFREPSGLDIRVPIHRE